MKKIIKQSIIFAFLFINGMLLVRLFLGKEIKLDIVWQGIFTAAIYGLFLYLDKRADEKKKS